MDMGVCCTNELAQNEALTCLREWLKMHGNPGLSFPYFFFSFLLLFFSFLTLSITEVMRIWERGEASRSQAGSVFVSNHKQVFIFETLFSFLLLLNLLESL